MRTLVCRTARVSTIAALLVLSTSVPAYAETYYGPEVRDLAVRSVDALRMHQPVMVTQLRLDDTLWHFAITARGTPATIQAPGLPAGTAALVENTDGAVKTIAAVPGKVTAIAATDKQIYWSDEAAKLWRVPR